MKLKTIIKIIRNEKDERYPTMIFILPSYRCATIM